MNVRFTKSMVLRRAKHVYVAFISKPEQIFLLLGIIFGFGYVIATPPAESADAASHLFRAYQVSQGYILSDRLALGTRAGGQIPVIYADSIYALQGNIPTHRENKFHISLLKSYLHVRIDTMTTKETYFEGAALYSPIPYLPQAF
jgi:hypothetical protein